MQQQKIIDALAMAIERLELNNVEGEERPYIKQLEEALADRTATTDKAPTESALIAKTLETIEAWSIEEYAANPESGVSLQQRYIETAQSYLEALKEEIDKRAERIGKPLTPLEALQNYSRDLRYQFGQADNHFYLINANSCGTPEFQNVLQCMDYLDSLDKAIEQLGGQLA